MCGNPRPPGQSGVNPRCPAHVPEFCSINGPNQCTPAATQLAGNSELRSTHTSSYVSNGQSSMSGLNPIQIFLSVISKRILPCHGKRYSGMQPNLGISDVERPGHDSRPLEAVWSTASPLAWREPYSDRTLVPAYAREAGSPSARSSRCSRRHVTRQTSGPIGRRMQTFKNQPLGSLRLSVNQRKSARVVLGARLVEPARQRQQRLRGAHCKDSRNKTNHRHSLDILERSTTRFKEGEPPSGDSRAQHCSWPAECMISR